MTGSETMTAFETAGFLSAALEREGAAVETLDDALVAVVLPPEVQAHLGLSESVSLRVGGACAPDEVSAAIESTVMQWLIERVGARGRIAGCALPGVRGPAGPVASRVLGQVQGLNATVRVAGTRLIDFQALVLEFQYAAIAEERAEGCLEVATDTTFGCISTSLARTLLERLPGCSPIPVRLDAGDLARAVARVDGVARAAITDGLAAFRSRLASRMARDARRITQYHDTLLSETRRRARAASTSKGAAILRARDEKLAELTARYGISLRYGPLSALLVSYPACACDLIVRRRQRDIPLSIVWDPVEHAALPVSCPSCTLPTLAFHACDESGHLTCAACAAPCHVCSRPSCRSCHPSGCPKCARVRAPDAASRP